MADENWKTWFEEAWEFREEKLYPTHFGSKRQGIYVLDGELFTNVFHQQSYDPRWLTHGVIEFEPAEIRSSWIYVSSGLSNAWEADLPQPNAPSGLGCEFLFQCPAQSRWVPASENARLPNSIGGRKICGARSIGNLGPYTSSEPY